MPINLHRAAQPTSRARAFHSGAWAWSSGFETSSNPPRAPAVASSRRADTALRRDKSAFAVLSKRIKMKPLQNGCPGPAASEVSGVSTPFAYFAVKVLRLLCLFAAEMNLEPGSRVHSPHLLRFLFFFRLRLLQRDKCGKRNPCHMCPSVVKKVFACSASFAVFIQKSGEIVVASRIWFVIFPVPFFETKCQQLINWSARADAK